VKRIGLTLGKFAPFHKGHQHVIDTALKEVDEMVVIIYDSKVTNIPLYIRANWIKQLYPTVKVVEAWNGPIKRDDIRQYEKDEEEYILHLLNGTKITHFYSSEYYGKHVSKALNAIDRRVDVNRSTLNISATRISENPYKYKSFVDDVVYRDLITKVVFLGAMSTGKSTVTKALAKKYNTTYASEYGREYWERHQKNRRLTLSDLDNIAIGHLEREEEAILNANRYCFIDTNAITTYMFSLDYHNESTNLLTYLANENYSRYDLFFVCNNDIPYDDTWDRSGDNKREVFQKKIIADLNMRKIPYILLSGDLETRIDKVKQVLDNFKTYNNYFGHMA